MPATEEKPTFISKTAEKLGKWISDVFLVQDSPDAPELHNTFTVPEANWMRQESLNIHLQPTKKILLEGDYYPRYDVSSATDGVVSLFDCSYHQYISFEQQNNQHDWTTDSVRQVYTKTLIYHVLQIYTHMYFNLVKAHVKRIYNL